MGVLMMIFQLLLGLMILVGVHEAGHMLAAKFFGMRVEKFSIGFPPKLFSFKWKGTEYSFGLIPLGGFVKISGMVDESLDTSNLNKEPEPWEFRAKPAWQRLIVMLGGIIVNIITGIFIFICLNYAFGKTFIPKEELKYGIHAFPLAQSIGLESGDKILTINGEEYDSFMDIIDPNVLLGDNSYYVVDRDGKQVRVNIPPSIIDSLSSEKPFLTFAFPYIVGEVVPESNADKNGLLKLDSIIRVNDKPAFIFHQLQEELQSTAGDTAHIELIRKGENIKLKIPVTDEGTIGFRPQMAMTINVDTINYTFVKSIGVGTHDAFNVLFIQVKAIGKIFSGNLSVSKSISSPIGIATQFGDTFHAQRFWYLVGLLSMVLALMNFLPIPALDGGHVVFLTYEILTGRKPSDKFLEVAVKIGIALLLSLMIFAFSNDIVKYFL